MGNCGVVDLVDKTGEVALTIGGLSGIFKGHDYLKGRFERTPYDKSSMRSVYHVRNIDEFRLKSMPPGNYSDYRIWLKLIFLQLKRQKGEFRAHSFLSKISPPLFPYKFLSRYINLYGLSRPRLNLHTIWPLNSLFNL